MDTPTNSFVALSDAMAEAVNQVSQSVVMVVARRRFPATGIVWDDAGHIVTANHVVERDEDITVGLPDGQEVPATIVGRDPSTDLVLLKVEGAGSKLTAAKRATEEARPGHLVLAIGRPHRSAPMAALGAVSAVDAEMHPRRRGSSIEGAIRPDLTMYPGFSGGPLINAAGEVIGLNTSGRGRHRRGLPIAIPVAVIDRVATTLREKGHIARAYLGVSLQPAQLPESAPQEAGLLIVGIEADSPAATAGLLLGDTLLALGETTTTDPRELQQILTPENVDQTLVARVLRAGEVQEINVTIGER